MQKHVNLVDLVKSFPTNIYLQNLASIQKRTSPVKFAHLAEKSGKGSISNLSTKVRKLRMRHGVSSSELRAAADLDVSEGAALGADDGFVVWVDTDVAAAPATVGLDDDSQ